MIARRDFLFFFYSVACNFCPIFISRFYNYPWSIELSQVSRLEEIFED
jgi:hypothetical protein